MLLVRDQKARAAASDQLRHHLEVMNAVFTGRQVLRDLHASKLAKILASAAHSRMYQSSLSRWASTVSVTNGGAMSPDVLLDEVFKSLPLLTRAELARRGFDALTRPPSGFLHYYESSGTTSDPVAAPKALDDLLVNTVNIGEMWGRLLGSNDAALILIIAPLAPAPYQFEKVLEYLGVMSVRPWVDYINGDYRKVLRLIRDLSLNVFVGAPSRLLAMIQFALREGMPAPRFDHLLLIAEQMGPSLLHHLEALTGARAYSASYGSSETGTIAVTCEAGQLHLQLQSFLLELRTVDGIRTIDGTADGGELVVTTLDLPSRPLLRYCTGDLVDVVGIACPCGLALPVMRTRGREHDLLAMPEKAVHQNDFESALWAGDTAGPVVLNYMLVVDRLEVIVLVTTDRRVDVGWTSATAERLGVLFPGLRLTVQPVDELSPLTSLSGDLGWKLSRVVDLGDEGMRHRLPAPIEAVVLETIDKLQATLV